MLSLMLYCLLPHLQVIPACDIMSQRQHHLILFLPKLQPHGIQITSTSSGFWYFCKSLGHLYSAQPFTHDCTATPDGRCCFLLLEPFGCYGSRGDCKPLSVVLTVWSVTRGCWILPLQGSSAEQTQIMNNVVIHTLALRWRLLVCKVIRNIKNLFKNRDHG